MYYHRGIQKASNTSQISQNHKISKSCSYAGLSMNHHYGKLALFPGSFKKLESISNGPGKEDLESIQE